MPKPIPGAPPAAPGSLAAALAAVPDPRHPLGWRPDRSPLPLVGLVQTAVAAMLCGARSLYAVAQWSRERVEDGPDALVLLGLPPGRSPSVATLHRVFKVLDVAAFARALGGWLAASGVAADDALALDGKTLRGIHGDAVPGVHLVAAFAHRGGAVLDQEPSPGKGQELAAVVAVLGRVPLTGRLVTGDALLTQRAVCAHVVARQGAYLLPVDANQPALLAACEAALSPMRGDGAGRAGTAAGATLAAGGVGAAGGGVTASTMVEPKARHGRREVRRLWALTDPALNDHAGSAGAQRTAWPSLGQVCRVERRRVQVRTGEAEVTVGSAITSRPPAQADAAKLLAALRGHWGIENRLHWLRDVTFDEDRSQIRSGAAPQAVAACRNLAITLLRRAGATNIAAATRTDAGRPLTAIALVTTANHHVMK